MPTSVVTIGYNQANQTMFANPSSVEVTVGTGALVTWVPGPNVTAIQDVRIQSYDDGAGWAPFRGQQPVRPQTGPEPRNIQWDDEAEITATYEYVVVANTSQGVRTLDPQIINRTGK